MKHRSRPPEPDDLLRPRLIDMIAPRHELVKLAALIDRDVFGRQWSGVFPSGNGRPATPPRMVAGRLYLQRAFRLSDEAVVARWVPRWEHEPLIDVMRERLSRDPDCRSIGRATWWVEFVPRDPISDTFRVSAFAAATSIGRVCRSFMKSLVC